MANVTPSTKVGMIHQTAYFTRHLLEMIVVMVIGMVAGAAVFPAPQGLTAEEGMMMTCRRDGVLRFAGALGDHPTGCRPLE